MNPELVNLVNEIKRATPVELNNRFANQYAVVVAINEGDAWDGFTSGGGIPLSMIAAKIVRTLADNGGLTVDEVLRIVKNNAHEIVNRESRF